MRKSLSITIAIPAFNEEENIEEAIKSANQEVSTLTSNYEILVVDDGSRDKTPEILSKLVKKLPHLRIVDHKVNQGIEPSLKDLYKNCKSELTFFNGADNEIKMSILPQLLDKLQEGYDIIVAKRKVKKYNPLRGLVSWGFNFFVKLMFGFDPYDAGCAKLFKTKIYKEIRVESQSVFGEAERLIRAHQAGYKIGFVEVTHYPKLAPSSIKINNIFNALIDLFRLYLKSKVT